MVKWTFEDDCQAPQAKIKIEYRGKNPFSMVQRIKPILQRIFEIETKDYWERDFRWDITSDPRSFYVRVYANKGLDFRSGILGEIIFQGYQPSDPNKDGSLVIFISAKLKTEFSFVGKFQNLAFYRGLIKIYNFMFYNKVRRGYIVYCNDLLVRVNRDVRQALSLPNAK